MSSHLGIDVGGTFTDFILLDDETGQTHVLKTPSHSANQSQAIESGLEKIINDSGISPADVVRLVHGTNVSKTTIVEKKGAKVGLLVTRGFEQILHLARSKTPGPLGGWKHMHKRSALADLEVTRGIAERMSAAGNILEPLEEQNAVESIRDLLNAGVQAITISLLHSYANPDHEKHLKAMINEIDPNMPVSLSSELFPHAQEYERTLVSVMNAYVKPAMQAHIREFSNSLQGHHYNSSFQIGRSDGGYMTAAQASERPIETLRASAAGGVTGAAYFAAKAGYANALCLDMGGTSTDLSMIENGEPLRTERSQLGQYPINLPNIDIRSLEVGGGSVAHVPITGALRLTAVGQNGSNGPACFGQGGELATVTDANLVLGRMSTTLLGSTLSLDVSAAENAVAKIADKLNVKLHQAAEGIIDLANEKIVGALRSQVQEKRQSADQMVLVAFGGAGPLHGNSIGRLIAAVPVIIPPSPGVLSAFGLLYGNPFRNFSQSLNLQLDQLDSIKLIATLSDLGAQATAWLANEGSKATQPVISYQIDARYAGQDAPMTLNVDLQELEANAKTVIASKLANAHKQKFGFQSANPIDIVNLRAIATAKGPRREQTAIADGGMDPSAGLLNQEQVYFGGQFLNTPVYMRDKLQPGNTIAGPAKILQDDTTSLVLPGSIATIDSHLNILIQPASRQQVGQQ